MELALLAVKQWVQEGLRDLTERVPNRQEVARTADASMVNWSSSISFLDRGFTPDEFRAPRLCTGEQDGFSLNWVGSLGRRGTCQLCSKTLNRDVVEADIENVILSSTCSTRILRNQTTSPEAWPAGQGFLSTCEGRSSVERTGTPIESLRGSLYANQKNSTLLVNIHQWRACWSLLFGGE